MGGVFSERKSLVAVFISSSVCVEPNDVEGLEIGHLSMPIEDGRARLSARRCERVKENTVVHGRKRRVDAVESLPKSRATSVPTSASSREDLYSIGVGNRCRRGSAVGPSRLGRSASACSSRGSTLQEQPPSSPIAAAAASATPSACASKVAYQASGQSGRTAMGRTLRLQPTAGSRGAQDDSLITA